MNTSIPHRHSVERAPYYLALLGTLVLVALLAWLRTEEPRVSSPQSNRAPVSANATGSKLDYSLVIFITGGHYEAESAVVRAESENTRPEARFTSLVIETPDQEDAVFAIAGDITQAWVNDGHPNVRIVDLRSSQASSVE